jgi:hypothetical protein
MKTKILSILIFLLIPVFILAGCNLNTNQNANNIDIGDSIFIILERKDIGYGYQTMILVNEKTKEMYLYVVGNYKGGVSKMLNADGTPMLWEG